MEEISLCECIPEEENKYFCERRAEETKLVDWFEINFDIWLVM